MYQPNPNRRGPMGVMPADETQALRPQPVQPASIRQDPTAMDMMKQQAMSKVAQKGVEKGMETAAGMYEGSALQGGVNSLLAPLMGGGAAAGTGSAAAGGAANAAAAGAAGAGAAGTAAAGAGLSGLMTAAGTAMPWLGAGLLGAKMLGLFSKGGLVGPLAGCKYKSNGGEVSDEVSYTFQPKS